MQKDLEHLRLLSIFYYVVGGLLALVSCFPIIHLVIGIMMIVAPPGGAGSGGPPPAAVGWVFVFVGGAIILVGWATAIGLAVAGWHLGRCRHYIFCMIMAGLACVFLQPFGTVLGVFTFIVLLRPSVKRLFETGGLPHDPEEADTWDEDRPEPLSRDLLNKGDASHFTR